MFLRANFSISPVIKRFIFGLVAKWENLTQEYYINPGAGGPEMVTGQWSQSRKNTNPSGEKASKNPMDRDQANISSQKLINKYTRK